MAKWWANVFLSSSVPTDSPQVIRQPSRGQIQPQPTFTPEKAEPQVEPIQMHGILSIIAVLSHQSLLQRVKEAMFCLFQGRTWLNRRLIQTAELLYFSSCLYVVFSPRTEVIQGPSYCFIFFPMCPSNINTVLGTWGSDYLRFQIES